MPLQSAEYLRDLTTRIFVKAGWSEQDSRETAEHLVLANLMGHDSHGVGMVPLYINHWVSGHLKPSSKPTTRIETAPFLVIDGNVALGQPTANAAIRRASAMAKGHGVTILNLLNAHHIGRIGHYAEMAAVEGLVSMFWVNVAGRPPIVAPFGARDARFGTNPHTIGVPDGDKPLILDFATSRMAHGKARVALNKGVPVPEGYLIDHEGRPTTDPRAVFDEPLGALMSFGDHKGAGIAAMVEILSAGLGGGATMPDTAVRENVLNSMFGILLDPSRLDPDEKARAGRISRIAAFQRAARPQPGVDRVRAPGDMEREVKAQRMRDGIPVDDGTWKLMVETAGKVGVKV